MAGSYNKVLLMGNLTRAPELKRLQSGAELATFGLAVNRKFKTAAGDSREEVVFVDCECWGRTAETIARYFVKGRPIFVEGRLRLDQWDANGGAKRSKLLVVVEGFQFVDSKPADGPRREPADGLRRAPAEATALGDDDIPF